MLRTRLQLTCYFVQHTLLFLGKSLLLSTPYSELAHGKVMVWPLDTRAQLLWPSFLRVWHDPSLTEAGKADFAVRAWLKTEAIESRLNTHTCSIERAFMYLGREYLFKCVHPILCLHTRVCILYEFQRFIPQVYVLHSASPFRILPA